MTTKKEHKMWWAPGALLKTRKRCRMIKYAKSIQWVKLEEGKPVTYVGIKENHPIFLVDGQLCYGLPPHHQWYGLLKIVKDGLRC